ncbi:ribonuclease P/MRP protein subunit POP5 isoform X2 [Bacillus rossius redtenbacheri]|uniref:ribonuclease P/MRP protein subunit POP5 isoform X2 n=1 Tax=Bacillus rossius redtenbacheri TaxID=93214 RepID=UPI002FDE298A
MVRHKNRYVVFEVRPQGQSCEAVFLLKSYSMRTAILKKVEQLYGDFGVAALMTGFSAKYCNAHTGVAIVRARHGPHRLMASCLPLVTHVDKHLVTFRTLYTGATLHRCFAFLQGYQLKYLNKLYLTLETDQEREEMKKEFLNLRWFKKEPVIM